MKTTSFLGMFSFRKKKQQHYFLSWKAIGREFKLNRIQVINLSADFYTSPYERGIDGNVLNPHVEMFSFRIWKDMSFLKIAQFQFV